MSEMQKILRKRKNIMVKSSKGGGNRTALWEVITTGQKQHQMVKRKDWKETR